MLNPHFVAGEHGLFGGHKSEDIRTFFFIITVQHVYVLVWQGMLVRHVMLTMLIDVRCKF